MGKCTTIAANTWRACARSKVDKLTNFENISVSRAVQFASPKEIEAIIRKLMDADASTDMSGLQLRYLMCSGPPMDLSALFSGSASAEQKQRAQKLLSAPQICEKLVIGCAVFEVSDFRAGFVVKDRVKN